MTQIFFFMYTKKSTRHIKIQHIKTKIYNIEKYRNSNQRDDYTYRYPLAHRTKWLKQDTKRAGARHAWGRNQDYDETPHLNKQIMTVKSDLFYRCS